VEKKYLIFLVVSSFFTLFSSFCFSNDQDNEVVVFEESENFEREYSFFDENLTSTADIDDFENDVDIAELDLDALEELGKQEGELSFSEKLALIWQVFKFKSGDHLKKYGKWYLCGVILTGSATAVYFKFIKKS